MTTLNPTDALLEACFACDTGVFIFAIHGRRLVKVMPCQVDETITRIMRSDEPDMTRDYLEFMLRFRNAQFLVFLKKKQIVAYAAVLRPLDVCSLDP